MSIKEFRELLEKSRYTVFFGGAGVSTESGIPDFRSATGLYSEGSSQFSPEEMLSHSVFMSHTKLFYSFYIEKMIYPDAVPNAAHKALAQLEKAGKLKAVITQNIDGLHQAAGSRSVYELHGSVHRNYCMNCKAPYTLEQMLSFKGEVPLCDACGGIVKPDVVLYEESLDSDVIEDAIYHISRAELLIVGGTSLAVYPAAGFLRYFKGDALVLINRDETPFDGSARLVIRDKIGEVLGEVMRETTA